MANRKSGSKAFRIARRISPSCAMIAVLGLLSLGGCSSSTASTPPTTPAVPAATGAAELHFSLDQCQPQGAGLYKCPAVDKPVCSSDYNGGVQCVRIGPKGSVFVQGPMNN